MIKIPSFQVNEGAQLSADVLNQLSNNPAMQRQINPLEKVAELVADNKINAQDSSNKGLRDHKRNFDVRNISSVCNII
jgi:hypothetical protein